MKNSSQIFSILLPVVYLLVVLFYAHIFRGRNRGIENKSPFILIILLIIHLIHIILRGLATGAIPLITKFDALSFLAFLMIGTYFVIELTIKNKATGLFVIILSFLIQTSSSIFYNWNITKFPLLNNPLYITHVVLTVIGYTGICISSLYALLYIILNNNIRDQRLGLIYEKLPPLNLLERISINSVRIGIISLGLGILIGHIRAGYLFHTFWPLDMKVIFSDIIWFGYFTGYIIAQLNKWRGRWMAYLSMAGFAVFILVNILIIFIDNTFHRFQ